MRLMSSRRRRLATVEVDQWCTNVDVSIFGAQQHFKVFASPSIPRAPKCFIKTVLGPYASSGSSKLLAPDAEAPHSIRDTMTIESVLGCADLNSCF